MNKKILLLIILVVIIFTCFACICSCFVINNSNNKSIEELKKKWNLDGSRNDAPDEQNLNTGQQTTTSETTTTNQTEENVTPQKYAVVISGISNDAQHYEWFKSSTNQAYTLLKQKGFTDQNIYYLFESANETNVDYTATVDNFVKVIEELQDKTTSADTIVMIFIGHGSSDGSNSYYSLSDYSLQDTELADMFTNVDRNKLIFVFSPCNSGGFVNDLSGQNTIVITSTRQDESNSAAFIEPFLSAFNGSGDSNGDGKVSFAEAFNYTSSDVKKQYQNNNWGELTEHAQLDDNADGLSHEAPMPNNGDGQLAIESYL